MSVQQLLDDTGVLVASEYNADEEEALFRATRIRANALELGLPDICEAARLIIFCLWTPCGRRQANLHACIVALTIAVERVGASAGL